MWVKSIGTQTGLETMCVLPFRWVSKHASVLHEQTRSLLLKYHIIFYVSLFVLKLPTIVGYSPGNGMCCTMFTVTSYNCIIGSGTSDFIKHAHSCLGWSTCYNVLQLESRTVVVRRLKHKCTVFSLATDGCSIFLTLINHCVQLLYTMYNVFLNFKRSLYMLKRLNDLICRY